MGIAGDSRSLGQDSNSISTTPAVKQESLTIDSGRQWFGMKPAWVDGVPVEIRPRPANGWQISNLFNEFDFKEKYLTCVDSDVDGNIWIAGSDGLYFYDGYHWTKYGTESGLPTEFVRSVMVAGDGTVWVGTAEGAGRFSNKRFEALNANLAGPSVRRIVEDREGAIWFCCDQWPNAKVNGGLTRYYGGETRSWTTADGLPSNYVSDFFEDSNGRQFVLTNVGLAEFDGQSFSLPLVEAGVWEIDTYVWSMVESPQHGLLVSTSSHFYNLKNGVWRKFPSTVMGHAQPKMVATHDGEILSRTNGLRSNFLRFNGDQWEPFGVINNEIRGGNQMLHEDSSGGIWVVGHERIFRWDRRDPSWQLFRSVGPPVATDKDNGVWFCSFKKGVLRRHGNKWYKFDLIRPKVIEDVHGTVWIQSKNELYVWESGNRIMPVDIPKVPALRFLDVDRENKLWMSRRKTDGSYQLFARSSNGDQWDEVIIPVEREELVYPACLDPVRGIWMVIAAGVDTKPSRLVQVQVGQQRNVSLPPESQISSIPSVHVSATGQILIGDFFGLFETTDQGDQWRKIETPGGFVSQISEINGRVWIVCRGHVGGDATSGTLINGKIIRVPGFDGRVVTTSDQSNNVFLEQFGNIVKLDSAQTNLTRPPLRTPFQTSPSSIFDMGNGVYWIGSQGSAFRYVVPETPILPEVGEFSASIYDKNSVFLPINIRERFRPKKAAGSYFISYRVGNESWSQYRMLDKGVLISDLVQGKNQIFLRVKEHSGKVTFFPDSVSVRLFPMPIQLRPWFQPLVMIVLVTIILTSVVAVVNWRRARALAIDLKREVVRKTGSLSESEGKYRLLFQESQDAILLTDDQANIKRYNESAAALFGEDLSYRKLTDLIAQDEDSRRIKSVLGFGDDIENGRLEMNGIGGRKIVALFSIKRMQSLGDGQASFQVIVRDTSELTRLQDRIAESEKLEALGRLAGGIAHDFNNFLAIILFGADLIDINSDGNPRIDQGLQSIVGGVKRGKALVAQIQSYNRAASQQPGSILVGNMLQKFKVIAENLLADNIRLVIQNPQTDSCIRVEENHLEQVLINLTVNASHAMKEGGNIRIGTRRVAGDQVPSILALDSAQSYIILEVEDDGCGMDSKLRAKIFDPFFTTKRAGEGTGLGLAIVYGIVKQSGGAIDVQSAPGEGTLFQIYIPESTEVLEEEEPESTRISIPQAQRRILVVDDEPELRRLIAMSLEKFGYSVSIAESGEEALHILAESDEYDLVISDILMNGMSGLELVDALVIECPHLPLLLISGYPQGDQSDSLQNVKTPILMKPFRPNELVQKVEDLLGASI